MSNYITSHWWDFGDYRITIVDQTIPAKIQINNYGGWNEYVYWLGDELRIDETNFTNFIAQLKKRPELLVTLKGNRQMKIIDDIKVLQSDSLHVGNVVVGYDDGAGADEFEHYLVIEINDHFALVDLDISSIWREANNLEELTENLNEWFDHVKVVNAELKLTNHE